MRSFFHSFLMIIVVLSVAACQEAGGVPDAQPPAVEADDQASVKSDPASDSMSERLAVKGTDWVLESINGQKTVAGTRVTLMLDENGSLYGSAGCNRYNGRYELDGATLKIHPAIASTMMACAEDAMKQEHQFHQLLGAANKAVVSEGNILDVTTDQGEKLSFRANW